MVFQIGSAILDACVLAILKEEDTYGYKLTQKVKEYLEISESTLYPVLRRLQKENYLQTYDQEVMGRNRRYYCLTEKGKEMVVYYQQEWENFSRKIDGILKGEEENG